MYHETFKAVNLIVVNPIRPKRKKKTFQVKLMLFMNYAY